MEALMKGDVVVLPFPFSDLSASKKRPAFIITPLEGDDVILCQITSSAKYDKYSLTIELSDFKKGSIKLKSMVRPNRLFTADKSIILYKAGSLKDKKIREIEDSIVKIIKQ